ncbi:MAG: hypothetical protein IJR99_04560 [Kiritimatiellae bacterium]|nr:hypothetical protein [Kiritimatiellia bacterium]
MVKEEDSRIAEDFFTGIEKHAERGLQRSRTRGKKKPEELFSNVKVEMVMRIYGVSRTKALEIITTRESEIKTAEGEGADRSTEEDCDVAFISAKEFFAGKN